VSHAASYADLSPVFAHARSGSNWRDSDTMKKVWLGIFLLLSAVAFFRYEAPAGVLDGCKNAAYTNVTYTAFNLTFSINKWVEYCSLTPIPGQGTSCVGQTGEGAYALCLTNFFPFLPGLMTQCGNYEAITCLSVPIPGESRISRVI